MKLLPATILSVSIIVIGNILLSPEAVASIGIFCMGIWIMIRKINRFMIGKD